MTRLIALIATVTFLQACAQVPNQGTGLSNSSANSHTQNQPATTPNPYQPRDREQFVIAEKPEQLQKYGFDDFCESIKSFVCPNLLDYDSYTGMKGYFKTTDPAHTHFLGYQSWPVVLENGRELFYVYNPEYGGKYDSSADIVPLEQYKRASNYSAQPLVPGSGVQVESVEIRFGRDVFILSNGDKIGREKLTHIRNIASKYQALEAEIAKKLLGFRISYDEFENQYFIHSKDDSLDHEAKLYIGVNPERTWLRMKIKYYGDDWLFVRSYKIAADSLRWESPVIQFERDHSGGNVWEWIDKSPTDQDLRNMRALASAENPIIRFEGRQYYSDFKLTNQQQNSISSILELYDLLRR